MLRVVIVVIILAMLAPVVFLEPVAVSAMTGSGTAGDPYMIYDVDDLQDMNTYVGGTRYSRPWDDDFGYAGQSGTWTTYPIEGYSPELFWNKVDEETSDGDSTYIQAGSDGAYCLLSPEATPLSLPSDATNIVVYIRARVRNTGSGTSYIQGMLNIDGTEYLVGSNTAVSSQSYALRTWTMTEYPPRGIGGWTVTDVYSLSTSGVGVKVSDAIPNIRITQLYLEVSYSMPAYYFELANDIDASATQTWNGGAGFIPVGDGTTFTGHFDGKNYTISGLYINRPSTNDVGLFGYCEGSTIRNVILASMNITGRRDVGALVGDLDVTWPGYVKGEVSNCHSSGTVIGNSPWNIGGLIGACQADVLDCTSSCTVSAPYADNVGGLVGWFYRWTVGPATLMERCSASGTVTGGDEVGGLIGGSEDAVIDSCFATGNVSGESRVGGLIGVFNREGSGEASLSDSYATGDVTSTGTEGEFGGLIGAVNYDSYSVTVENSYSTGEVYADGCYDVGGFIGYLDNDVIVRKCFTLSNVIGDEQIGGFVGECYGSTSDCYARGSVTGTSYVGGFVGESETGSNTTNCYSVGKVTGSSDVGGFCGLSNGTILNSFWDTQTSGQPTSDGGTGKNTTEMKTETTFTGAGWAFEEAEIPIWNIADNCNDGYPYLCQFCYLSWLCLGGCYIPEWPGNFTQVLCFQPNAMIEGTILPNRT